MKVELWNIADVKPYEQNPRVNEPAVDAVIASIREFGWRQPIVVDAAGVIIVGHTRWKAAKKMGLAQVPVHVAGDLPPEKARAYRIADNQTADLSDWDMDKLPAELLGLQESGYEMANLGFGDELARMMTSGTVADGLTDPDAIPAMPDAAITQPGDLITLGDHRLLCGDSGSEPDLDRLLALIGGLPSHAVHLVNTDPPYGVRVEPRSNNAIAAGLSSFGPTNTAATGGQQHQGFDAARRPQSAHATDAKLRPKDRPLMNDFVSEADFDRMLDAWFSNIARVLSPGRAFYIWGGYANLANYPAPLKKHGLYFSQAVVWDKQHPVLTRKDMMGAFEIAFYGWRQGAGHHFFGPNNATDLWHVKKVPPQAMIHLTEKPVELAVRAILYSSVAGENVLDLFGGSGSTLIACEQTGRHAFLMELDPLYCDVIVQRWEEFTGKKAVRPERLIDIIEECIPGSTAAMDAEVEAGREAKP